MLRHAPTIKQSLLSSPQRQAQVFPQHLECSTSTSKLTGCIYLYRKESGRKMYLNVILKVWGSVSIHWNVTVSGISTFRFNWKALKGFNHSGNCLMITGSYTFMWTKVLCMHAVNIRFPALYPTDYGTLSYTGICDVCINTRWFKYDQDWFFFKPQF